MTENIPQAMSPEEKTQHLQSLQKASPLNKISDAVKKMSDSAFGLSKDVFEKTTLAVKGIQGSYQAVAKKDKRFGINQHVPGLTMNVRGQEQLIHEQVQEVNVDLPDGRALEQKRGLYLDDDWSPKQKGKVE